MAGFSNDIVFADNVDFSGGFPVAGQITQNGQLLIGSVTAPNIRVATLTAGANVSITNGEGTITIAASGGSSLVWTDEDASFTAISNAAYFATDALTMTLPDSPAQGETVSIICLTANPVVIQAAAGQVIRSGSSVSATAGTLTSTSIGDGIALIYNDASSTWVVLPIQGNWDIA